MAKTVNTPTIERVPIGKLRPWKKNPRIKHAVDGIARSIETFGYLNPIIVQKGTYRILAGHERLAALKKSGVLEVPVVIADISNDEADLLTIADNRLAEQSGWSDGALADILSELKRRDLDIELAGFTERELEELLGEVKDTPADTDPGTIIPISSIRGDLWQVGPHRILCGDATSQVDYDKLMEGELAQVVHIDPPYGVDYESDVHGKVRGDDMSEEKLGLFLLHAFADAARVVDEGAAWYIWHASSTRSAFEYAMKSVGLLERQYLIWVKPIPVLGHADYQWAHEPCFYAARAGEQPKWYGDRRQPTVWRIGQRHDNQIAFSLKPDLLVQDDEGHVLYLAGKHKKRRTRIVRLAGDQILTLSDSDEASNVWEVSRDARPEHPTQKPMELARRALMNSSQPGEIALDFFLGSGSTILAAETLNRRGFGMDLEPRHIDTALFRLMDLAPKLEVTCSRAGAAEELRTRWTKLRSS